MFGDDISAAGRSAAAKRELLKHNPAGYFSASLMAGVFVGFGVLLAYTIGDLLSGQPYAKIVMGASFGVALSLVLMAGAELFTGNNLTAALGMFTRDITPSEALRLWSVCYIGNWLGAVVLALLFWGAGYAEGSLGEFMASASAVKMNLPFSALFLRGLLCNALVCLAVWCAFRCKSESAKLIMVFWCLFAFIITGFEHGIANMTLFTVALLAPSGADVTLGGYFYNILTVTLGNMAGGVVCVALPYFVISNKK